MPKKTTKITVFGKGGIGKSTTCANLAAAFAGQGKKVLLVGCDPKHDTTISLTKGKPIPTAVSMSGFLDLSTKKDQLVHKGSLGIDCIESGGPEPGIGCAGRGISRTIEMMEQCGLMEDGEYDVMLFDVLGDVVCGGFAAPLKLGFADMVVIVASEELMALYAANNISRAIVNYASNGIGLLGIIANLKDYSNENESAAILQRFTNLINTEILCCLPRDLEVRKAEYERKTCVEYNPRAKFSKKIEELSRILLERDIKKAKMPIPLTDREFLDLSRVDFNGERKHKEAGRARSMADESPEMAKNYSGGGQKRAVEIAAEIAAQKAAGHGGQAPSVIPLSEEEDQRLEQILSVWAGAKDKPNHEGPHGKVWGNPEQWRMFFADFEIWRNQEQAVYLDTPIVGIAHEDSECNFATPYYDDGHMVPFNVPWAARWATQKRQNDNYLALQTNIMDSDVIKGGVAKLKDALDTALENLKGKKAILIKSTCIPTIIGDDAEGLIEQYQKKTDLPIVYNNPSADHCEDPIEILFSNLKKSPGFQKQESLEGVVNLVGFPPGPAFEELKRLLRDAGIRVNVVMLPRFSLDDAAGFMRACLTVLYPDPALQDIYKRLFDDMSIKKIMPIAPYGLQNTRKWLVEVAKACAGPGSAEQAWAGHASRIAKKWTRARDTVREQRLGFVVDGDKVHRLAGVNGIAGVPMIPMIKEMGFGIDYFAYLKGDEPPTIPDNGPDGKPLKHRIMWFKTPGELDALLRAGHVGAVYSEYFFDQRLTAAGVPQFSIIDMEMGLRGARRTLERLARICRWTLYRRYGGPAPSRPEQDGAAA